MPRRVGRLKSKEVHTSMAKRLSKMTGEEIHTVRRIMMAFIRCTINDLAQGKEVHMLSLGKFWCRKYEPREHWDPHRKKISKFGVHYVPKFTYGPTAYNFIRREAVSNCEGAKG